MHRTLCHRRFGPVNTRRSWTIRSSGCAASRSRCPRRPRSQPRRGGFFCRVSGQAVRLRRRPPPRRRPPRVLVRGAARRAGGADRRRSRPVLPAALRRAPRLARRAHRPRPGLGPRSPRSSATPTARWRQDACRRGSTGTYPRRTWTSLPSSRSSTRRWPASRRSSTSTSCAPKWPSLEEQASVPDLWDDTDNAQKVTSRLSFVQGEIRRVEDLRRRVDDAQVLWDLAEEADDAGVRAEAEAEVGRSAQGDRRARGAHAARRASTTRARRW